ncbi:RNA-directed DNA polymerase, eukaryota, reverse transcriptase zinc-binding domain protein [Tanacetum coccineum]
MELDDYEKAINHDEKLDVDWHVLRKQKPSIEDSKKWSYEMLQYFKLRWQIVNQGVVESYEDEDIINDQMNDNEGIIADEIAGKKLQICAFVETHLKQNIIARIGSKVFGQWEWISNLQHSPTSCRIMLGWNPFDTKVMVLSMSKHAIFCLLEVFKSNIKFYCTFVYASNSGYERRTLWKELEHQKNIVGDHPWLVLGDFKVTMDTCEHSSRGFYRTMDMQEFKETVNSIEMEDLCSNGFHFTWTKSLKNPKCTTLKKLDRMLVNEKFMDKYPKAFGEFLPFLISDHSHAVLFIKEGAPKKKKSFRFLNFITRKEEFIKIMKKEWDVHIQGSNIFKLVQKLKKLKHPLNKLSWSKGNLFNNVKYLKDKLKLSQENMINNPHDESMKKSAVDTLNEYIKAVSDELVFLKQKSKSKFDEKW